MTQSETQERLKQRIRKTLQTMRRVEHDDVHAHAYVRDVTKLLSLIDTRAPVDSQGTEADEWRTVAEKYQALVARTEDDTATQMRTACVKRVKAAQAKHEQTAVNSEDYEYDQCIAMALSQVAVELESLTLR